MVAIELVVHNHSVIIIRMRNRILVCHIVRNMRVINNSVLTRIIIHVTLMIINCIGMVDRIIVIIGMILTLRMTDHCLWLVCLVVRIVVCVSVGY